MATNATKKSTPRRRTVKLINPNRRYLYVIRHAQADKNYDYDFERNLTKKGKKQTKRVADRIRTVGAKIDLIIASSALRSHNTAMLLVEHLGLDAEIIIPDMKLYGATVNTWLNKIRRFPNTISSAVIVGHNPELELLLRKITAQKTIVLPPSGCLSLSFDDEWSQLAHTPNKTADKTAGKTADKTADKMMQIEWSSFPKKYAHIRPEVVHTTNQIVKQAIEILPNSFNKDKIYADLEKSIAKTICDLYEFHRRSIDLEDQQPITNTIRSLEMIKKKRKIPSKKSGKKSGKKSKISTNDLLNMDITLHESEKNSDTI